MSSMPDNITRIKNAKTAIKTSIINKGVTVPDSAKIDTYASYIDQITGSTPTPTPTPSYQVTVVNVGTLTVPSLEISSQPAFSISTTLSDPNGERYHTVPPTAYLDTFDCVAVCRQIKLNQQLSASMINEIAQLAIFKLIDQVDQSEYIELKYGQEGVTIYNEMLNQDTTGWDVNYTYFITDCVNRLGNNLSDVIQFNAYQI